MAHSPKVSVVIPVYNSRRYVSEAIESILSQSFTDFELVLIDDASTDGSLDVLRSFEVPRVRVEPNEVNLGLAGSHNRGIDLARGQYLAMLDHDDCSYPERLATQVAFLDRHPDHALVGGWSEIMDEQGRTLKKRKRYPVSSEAIRVGLLFGCALFHPSIMARRDIMQRYRYCERFSISDDFDLFVRLARSFELGNVPEVLVRHRRHDASTSNRKAHLKEGENVAIFADQMSDLGVSYTEDDLKRHYILGQMGTLGFTPDLDYLDWAESWLGRLRAANERALRYPEPELSRVLRQTWLKVCWHASARIGWASWKRCLRSPLTKGAWSSIGEHLVHTCLPQKGKV